MALAAHEHVESILDTLACPECAYSLRGLSGETVTCPECGKRVNVQAYVAARWRQPWFRAPLYNLLAAPAIWVKVGSFALLLFARSGPIDGRSNILLVGLVVLVIVWIALMGFVARRFGSMEGLWLALVLHLSIAEYLLGVVSLLFGSLAVIARATSISGLVLSLVATVGSGVGLIGIAYLTERLVARRCIRRHLRLSAGATMEREA